MSVFEQSFVNDMSRKFRRLPPFQRPLIANIALEDQRGDERARIESWVNRMDWEDRDIIVQQLRHPNRFIRMYGELAVAQILIESRCTVRYEQVSDGVAPDWTCRLGDEAFLCEVFTAGLPDMAGAHGGALLQLTGRLSAIPQPYLVRVEVPIDFTLDSTDLKKIAADVSAWLKNGVGPGDDWFGSQITITVLGPSRDRLDVVVTDELYTTPNPVSVGEVIRERADRYGATGLPLLIAMVKHPRAEADVVTFIDGALGVAEFRRMERDGKSVSAKWRRGGGGFDKKPQVSAGLWLHPYRGGRSERLLVTNPEAARPLPKELVERLEAE